MNTVPLCGLDLEGPPRTLIEVEAWVAAAAARLRASAGADERTTCRVWAYRFNGEQYIAADFDVDELARQRGVKSDSITFCLGCSRRDYCSSDPLVPDAVEAMHMLALLTHELNVVVTIGTR